MISSEQPADPDVSPGTTDDVPAPTIEKIVAQNNQNEVARPIIEDQAPATQQILPESRETQIEQPTSQADEPSHIATAMQSDSPLRITLEEIR